jgi:hypothetical protein
VYLVLMSFAENLAGHTVYTKTYRLIEKWKWYTPMYDYVRAYVLRKYMQ